MPITNNLYGIGTYGTLQVGPNPSGAILFVNSVTGQDSRGRVSNPGATATSTNGSLQGPQVNPAFPLASLAYALTFTKAGRGDIVILQQGHTETWTADVTCSSAGVAIVGLGAKGERPTITVTGVGLILAGVGNFLQNVAFVAGTTANTAGVVQLTAKGCTCQSVKVAVQNVTTVCFVNNAQEQIFDDCEVNAGTTGCDQGIQLNAFDFPIIRNCYLWGIFATAPINFAAAATDVDISNNLLEQLSGTVKPVIAGIVTAVSGVIRDNRFVSATSDTAAHFFAGTNVATNTLLTYLQNFGFTQKAGPSSGILVPTAGTIP